MGQATKVHSVKLQLLGTMAYNNRAVKMPRKARALLAFVAASARPQPREELIGVFCADTVDPRRTLRTLLSRIRRETPDMLATGPERVSLHHTVWVDCHEFAKAVRADAMAPDMLSLYQGDFMAGEELPDSPEYEMWLLGRRAHYKSLYEQALLAVAEQIYDQGEVNAAHSYAAQLVQSNPYWEEGQALLIQVLAAAGGLVEARAQYDRFCALLEQELGVTPTDEFRERVGTVLAARAADRAKRAPIVPAEATTASGRQQPLLFSPARLQERLGDRLQREQWQRLQKWALATAQTARALWAYQDVVAALETALMAAERVGAPAAQQATILLQRILLGPYVGEPLSVQQERLERAEALLSAAPETAPVPLLELARATVLYREGRYGPATEAAAEAAAHFQAAGDYGLAGRALTVQGQSLLRTGQNTVAINVLQRARPWLAEAGDEEGLSVCVGETAWAAINRGRIEEAFAIVEEGLATVRAKSLPGAEARLLYTRAACWNYYYDAGGMERSARQAIERYEQIGNRALAARCEIYLVQAERYRLQREAAQQRLGTLFQKAQIYHDTWLMAWVMALLGQAAFREGRLEEAEKWYRQAYGLRQRTGERQNQVYDLAWTGRLRAALGRLDSALHYTIAAVRQMQQGGDEYFPWESWDMYLAHAEVLSQNGREEKAQAALDAGYRVLRGFVRQIPSSDLRQQVLDFEHSRHLLAAWSSRQIIPFHQREHTLI